MAFSVQAADQNPQIAAQIKKGIDKNYEMPHFAPGMSKDEYHARMALHKAKTPLEKWDLIKKGGAAAQAAGVEGMDRFDWGSYGKLADVFAKPPEIGDTTKGLGQMKEGREHAVQRGVELEAHEAQVKRGLPEEGRSLERAKAMLQTYLDKSGSGMFSQYMTKGYFNTMLPVGEVLAPARGKQDYIAGTLGAIDPKLMREYEEKENKILGYEKFDVMTGLLKSIDDKLGAKNDADAKRHEDNRSDQRTTAPTTNNNRRGD
jgi:hypothetical protein